MDPRRSRFRLIAQGVSVDGVNAELDAHAEWWSENAYRTASTDSPHHGVPDIWLRFRRKEELISPTSFREPHLPVFWPAWRMLPSLHPIVRNLSHVVDSVALGGILLTRIEPGESVAEHVDTGWHALYYDTKVYICLAGNPFSINWVEDEAFSPREGDCFSFSNQKRHRVTNDGPTTRVTAIICFRSISHDISEAG
jgi:hypothetical protein